MIYFYYAPWEFMENTLPSLLINFVVQLTKRYCQILLFELDKSFTSSHLSFVGSNKNKVWFISALITVFTNTEIPWRESTANSDCFGANYVYSLQMNMIDNSLLAKDQNYYQCSVTDVFLTCTCDIQDRILITLAQSQTTVDWK